MLQTSTRAAAEAVGEVAAEQAEDASGDRRVRRAADPVIDSGAPGGAAEQFGERRPHDQRQHQQLIGVEGEAERRDAQISH